MEALLLQDAAYVSDRYEELQAGKQQLEQLDVATSASASCAFTAGPEASVDWELEHWRIVQRAKALAAQGSTPQLDKKFLVLETVLGSLYAAEERYRHVTSPPNGALKRLEAGDNNGPVPLKELPLPTQVVLRMFFRTCRSLRDPTKLAANWRLSVQIASKLPGILTAMPSCALSPGLVDDTTAELEDGGGVCSVFYQLFRLFEALLGLDEACVDGKGFSVTMGVTLSAADRATVVVAYVALSLKWGRLGYLLKGVKLLLECASEIDGTRFDPLVPLFRELAAASIERPQIAFGEEEQPCGYLMSFGKGDHGKLGHGQCAHVSCQEGNCTENKMLPTIIAATRDVQFRKIDSLSTHSIAITAKGEAMAWGNGDKYRLGHGSSAKEYTPRTIEFLGLKGKVRDLACGLGHTLALMESGELFVWGNGSNGRLGLSDTNDRSSPTRVAIPTTPNKHESGASADSTSTSTTPVRFRHVFCGASHSLGLSWDGRTYAWGKNNQGQCGLGHTNDQWTIQEIDSFHDTEDGEADECVIFAAGGWEHTLFCTAAGRVYSCGCGYKDSRRAGIPPVLGHGDCDRRLKPTLVQALDDGREEIFKVACGWDHSLAVSASGRVYTWGSGTNGKLGHGDEESFDIPTLVRSMEGKRVKDAKAGCEHTVFLTHDHELWTCGQGDSGRLGHGDSQTRKRPTKIDLFDESGLKPVALAVGDKYNLVLVKDGDGQYEPNIDSASDSVPKAAYRVGASRASANVHHGRHRSMQHKKHLDSQQFLFGSNWVLSVAAGSESEGNPATRATNLMKDGFTPDSAHGVALFIAGQMDRLASDYITEEPETQSEKHDEPNAIGTHSKVHSVLLPFAVDTSCESFNALVQLLESVATPAKANEKLSRVAKSGSGGLATQERMSLALSCLRILQLNLNKTLCTPHVSADTVEELVPKRSMLSVDLLSRIHELLDSLASLKEEDMIYRFCDHQSGDTQNLAAVGKAISQEAASALKMGFCMFYPTERSRCSLLWEILDECKVHTPSMRTVILSDQLCKDSIMTEIFRRLPSNGLFSLTDEVPGAIHNDGVSGKDIFEVKFLMIALLKRSSADAIKHLDNEAFADFTLEPDCFLRLLHVLQTHYFSVAHRSASQNYNMDGNTGSNGSIHVSGAREQFMGSLLEYVDALMAEALAVLKRLHKGSRQHEEIITWRLNGGFFHTLLPSAIECLSVLLLPQRNGDSVPRNTENFLLVERILPNLHLMLKMLDEVSWKMHTAEDLGNQAHDDGNPSLVHHVSAVRQNRNWFVDLGDACAVLCGKLSCELFYPSQHITNLGTYNALVLAEGCLVQEEYAALSTAYAPISSPVRSILEWESLGVFEVEDELVGSEIDPIATVSTGSTAYNNWRFLLQFIEADFSRKPLPFWSWVAANSSHTVDFSTEMQRLLSLVASVSSWHLGLTDELQRIYELYEFATRSSLSTDKVPSVPTSGVWGMLSTLLRVAKLEPWFKSTIDADTVSNATKLSRLLLKLRANPALVPRILRRGTEALTTDSCADASWTDLLGFLTNSVDADAVQRSLVIKELDAALVRTGICILHDLLRKLTTSSAKSCLLGEFVAVACTTSQMSLTTTASTQFITLSQGYHDTNISKAIENLFIRLARIVSSDEASFELKKKALLAWTMPLGTTKQSIPSVVALIAKSGIMSTLVELLINEDTHSDGNLPMQPLFLTVESCVGAVKGDGKWGRLPPGAEARLPTKLAAIKTLLFDQTPPQIISVLAWEAFSAISLQLSRSEPFAQHRAVLLLRPAESTLHEREFLTPLSASMSPRRRLTLPKKMIVWTIDEIIEHMVDGLFLMLKGAKDRLETLGNVDMGEVQVEGKGDTISDLQRTAELTAGALNDVSISHDPLTEETAPQEKINGTVLFRLKQKHLAESTCGKVLRLLCQLVGPGEQTPSEPSLARISFSDRWITLLTRMLLSTCRDQDVTQVYLCHLLQNVLPRAPPPPDFNVQALHLILFGTPTSHTMTTSVAALFDAFKVHDQTQLASTSLARRHNEALYRTLQQYGILDGKPRGESLFVNKASADEVSADRLATKTKISMRFASCVHLIQKLYSTPSWRSRMDTFIAGSTAIFQSAGGLNEALQREESSTFKLDDLRAVVNAVAGYSEDVLNVHRASVQDTAIFPLPLHMCSASFDSVVHLNDSNADQAAYIQGLLAVLVREETRQALCLPARKDILSKCHNDVAAVNAADLQVESVTHLRSRILRVLMATLLREQGSITTSKTWHHFLLENTAVCDDLLRVATSYTKESVLAMLGPDAKLAMKRRRVRSFIKEALRGSKHRRSAPLTMSISELEILQWRLWEETNSRHSRVRAPWWQETNEGNEKLTLEVVGGDVEMWGLKVKAVEHFPTVRLAQANIGSNSGLWFFEVVVLTDGLMQIGYVDGDFTADPLLGQGVGDHTNSWAFDGFRCKRWNVNSYDYGEQWKTDDVVGVLLDTGRMELSYFLNGKFLGVAFSGLPITVSSRMCPAASLNVQQSAEFNFGTQPPANEEGLQTLGFGGFKHLPALDNEDQSRLRPLILALQTRRVPNADGGSIADSPDKVVNGASDDWSSSSNSNSDTDDGEIVLEHSVNLSDFRRTLDPASSRDGRDTRTTDQTDEEYGQRRRDLVEGLTGLGFSLEWAARCASETRLPMDEAGAVAWILEQMERSGLNGASSLPSTSIVSDDGMENPGQVTALWNTRAQLPNIVASNSADDLVTGSSLLTGTGISNPLEGMGGNEISKASEDCDSQIPIGSAFRPRSSTSGSLNAFVDGNNGDQQSDFAASEAFQSGSYRQCQLSLHAELQFFEDPNSSTAPEPKTHVLDRKPGVDDLLPLSIAIDTTVFVAYSRQAFASLLLLALCTDEHEAVYKLVRRLISTEESSSRFRRFLRLIIGLDTMDAAFEVGPISGSFRSERSLALQKALTALLQYEAQNGSGERGSDKNAAQRQPLFDSFCQEMLSECDRGLGFVRSKLNSKIAAEPTSIQSAAAWFAWVSGLVIGFAETRVSASCGDLSIFGVAPFCSTSFVDNLMMIAASPSSASKAWKYVAFRLISRILFSIRTCESISRNTDSPTTTSADTPSTFFASAQLSNLTELFAIRRRREMFSRVFFSDTSSALFALLVRSTAFVKRVAELDKRLHSESQCVSLRVNSYSSTHATISWDQTSHNLLPSLEIAESDNFADDSIVSSKAEIDSAILFLEVKRCGPQMPGCALQEGSRTNALKALPPKGTFTIRDLLPDTQYHLRLAPAQYQGDAVHDPSHGAGLLQDGSTNGAEVILQTPLEPVFELDQDTMGKNLVVFSRSLSAKNTVNKKWHSVRASVAFDEGIHQWQVRLDTCVSKNIFIGVCTAEASMENYIGSDAYGYGFLANKAVWHNKAKLHSYGEIFKQGDTIQVTLDCNAKTLAFSRNGEYLGIAASNMRAGTYRSGVGGNSSSDDNCKWYPAFSMYNKDDKVTIIPPPAGSMFSSKEGRPQNASTFELIEAMQDVLTYDNQQRSACSSRDQESTQLYEKAFEVFEGWRREEKIFREIALGQVIVIDKSKAATDKYGLATGDSVFTSKGQCTVLGEYRHELWYEVDEGGSSSLFGTSMGQLASWSLTTSREMMSSPDEYPVHRHHKYKLELESEDISGSLGSAAVIELESTADANEAEALSFQAFVDAQERWCDNDVNAADLDAKLIAELDTIAMSQASSSPFLLSFADVSTTLMLEKMYGVSAERGSNQTLARIGLLLYVNQCLYNVVRVAMPRNTFAVCLGTSEGSDSLSKQPSSSEQATPVCNTECVQVSPVAALLNSPHWALDDPSAFNEVSAFAARLLFSSQKEKLIEEELQRTKTASDSDSLQEPSDNDDSGTASALPMIKVSYPVYRAVPFWEQSTKVAKKEYLHLTSSTERSVFVQLAKQLAAQDARQWRQESLQPFEAIPISQAFRVHVEKLSTESCENISGLEQNSQQQDDDGDEQELQQPSSKQTAKYLQLFEDAVRELQSPSFPIFAPVELGASEDKPRQELELDVNLELFSPSSLAHSRLESSQLLLWYYCVGQILGIAWRSKLLLPLQYVSTSFWEELVSPADPAPYKQELEGPSGVREVAISAVRDGLFSIIPSRCVALLSGSNPSLRERLSDLDVSYVARLENHATYIVPHQSHHHDMFWKVLNDFTSVERRMLEQFVNPERRNEFKKVEGLAGFVLEVADALADGRDHPDSCYPVVVPIGPHSSRLHLPAYSSATTLRQKLLLAMTNIPFM